MVRKPGSRTRTLDLDDVCSLISGHFHLEKPLGPTPGWCAKDDLDRGPEGLDLEDEAADALARAGRARRRSARSAAGSPRSCRVHDDHRALVALQAVPFTMVFTRPSYSLRMTSRSASLELLGHDLLGGLGRDATESRTATISTARPASSRGREGPGLPVDDDGELGLLGAAEVLLDGRGIGRLRAWKISSLAMSFSRWMTST